MTATLTPDLATAHGAGIFSNASETRWWRRLWAHPGGRFGVLVLLLLAVMATVGPMLTVDPNAPDYTEKLQAPGSEHWLGTDVAGRDLLARTLAGARTSLGASLLVMVTVTAIGLVVGVIAGATGGIVDRVLSRVIDVMLGLPSLVMTLALVAMLGPSFVNLIIAMALTGWAGLAKLARAYTQSARTRPDVVAARMAGAGRVRIALGHVLPGAFSFVVVASTLRLGSTVVELAGLSFLGLGAQPPIAEWGAMLNDSRQSLTSAPFLLIGPALGLTLTVLAATILSDALRDVADLGESGEDR